MTQSNLAQHSIKPTQQDYRVIAKVVGRKPDTVMRILKKQGHYKKGGPLVDAVELAWMRIVQKQLDLKKELADLKDRVEPLFHKSTNA